MPAPESSFPEGMSIVEKDAMLRQAHRRWSDFPDAAVLGDVMRQMAPEVVFDSADLAEISVDPETNEVSLPPTIEASIETQLSADPDVMRRRTAVMKAAPKGPNA